jgi:hypothetical protein
MLCCRQSSRTANLTALTKLYSCHRMVILLENRPHVRIPGVVLTALVTVPSDGRYWIEGARDEFLGHEAAAAEEKTDYWNSCCAVGANARSWQVLVGLLGGFRVQKSHASRKLSALRFAEADNDFVTVTGRRWASFV